MSLESVHICTMFFSKMLYDMSRVSLECVKISWHVVFDYGIAPLSKSVLLRVT